jgi:hypothetical protein
LQWKAHSAGGIGFGKSEDLERKARPLANGNAHISEPLIFLIALISLIFLSELEFIELSD